MFDSSAFMARLSGPPLLMGILNITPDSFSDGGRFLAPETAIAEAAAMTADGADILDIGGESTRPGHAPINAATEWARVRPVLEGVRQATSLPISIDTYKAETAARARHRRGYRQRCLGPSARPWDGAAAGRLVGARHLHA